MRLFIILTFVSLAFAYYVMSGGADFVPETQPVRITDRPIPDPLPVRETAITDTPTPTEIRIEDPAPIEATPAPAAEIAPATATIDVPEDQLETSPASPDLSEIQFDSLADALAESVADTTTAETSEPQPEAPTQEQNILFVGDSRLNLRTGPGTENAVLVTMNPGTELLLLSTGDEGWVQVEISDSGLQGWTAEEFLVSR